MKIISNILICVFLLTSISYANNNTIDVSASNVDKTVKCGELVTVEWASPKEGDGEVVFKVKPLDISYQLAGPGQLYIASPCKNVVITVECYRIDYENRKFETKDINIKVIANDYVEPSPTPNPQPNPDPTPKPNPPPNDTIVAKWAVWLEEQNDRYKHIDQTSTMLNLSFRNYLNQRQIQIRIYDKDEASATSYNQIPKIKDGSIKLPALFLIGDTPSDYLLFEAPMTVDEGQAIIERNTVR